MEIRSGDLDSSVHTCSVTCLDQRYVVLNVETKLVRSVKSMANCNHDHRAMLQLKSS